MRSGLQGRWREATASLRAGAHVDGRYLDGKVARCFHPVARIGSDAS